MLFSRKLVYLLLSSGLFVISIWLLFGNAPGQNNNSGTKCSNTKGDTTSDTDVFKVLETSLKHLVKAHRFTRDSKAAVELRESIALIKQLLVSRHNSFGTKLLKDEIIDATSSDPLKQKQPQNQVPSELDVCPEYWIVPPPGYPYYFDNFRINPNCTTAPAFGSILTIVLNVAYGTDPKDLLNVFKGISESYAKVPILLGLPTTIGADVLTQIDQFTAKVGLTVIKHTFADKVTQADSWNELLSKVQTKYVFVGRSLAHFTSDARLERLVRLLNYASADIVGGSYRNISGHWSIGCYQTAMRNYAIKIVEGYDLSYNSCIYCDFAGGPFAARTSLLKQFFNSKLYGDALFLNGFLKIREANPHSIFMVCPDAMFITQPLNISSESRENFLPFVQSWELNDVILPSGHRHVYTCPESNSKCSWLKGIAMPLCCLRELSGVMRLLMQLCDEHNIGCEFEGGSIVGSIKFNGNLPWERDGDINYRAVDHEKLLSLAPVFKQHGYTLEEDKKGKNADIPKCASVTSEVTCGYFALRSANWRIEIWGLVELAQKYLDAVGIRNATRIPYDGLWVRSYPNPALFSRNLYGDDSFEHVEHWISLGYSTGWVPYETGKWLPCPRPGFHGCLDQYLPYGNLQFFDVWV